MRNEGGQEHLMPNLYFCILHSAFCIKRPRYAFSFFTAAVNAGRTSFKSPTTP